MPVEQFKVKGKHELDLYGIRVIPKKEPKAIIQIFHGMGEHKNRYIPFMEFMAENGYAVYAHDHRKHGESVSFEEGYGIFEKDDRWDDVLDDCYFVTRKILKDFPGTKLIVLGHSMGSIIARAFISRNPLIPTAAIIMGTLPPYTPLKALVPRALAGLIALFTPAKKRNNFLAETLNKPLLKDFEEPQTKFDWLTYDKENIEKYIEDPLCGYAYTPKFYTEFLKAIVDVNKSDVIMNTKDIPILFISGVADPVSDNGEGVRDIERIYNGHGYTQLTIKLVQDARHEVLNDTNKQETFDYLKEWCDKVFE